MPLTELISSLSTNPYFGAGFGLVGIGAGLAYARRGYEVGKIVFKRHCLMSLEMVGRDKSFDWVLSWIARHSQHSQHLSVETDFRLLESGKIQTAFNFVPSPGIHFISYKNTWIKVERLRENQALDLKMGGVPFETVKMTCFGRNKQIYYDILEQGNPNLFQA